MCVCVEGGINDDGEVSSIFTNITKQILGEVV